MSLVTCYAFQVTSSQISAKGINHLFTIILPDVTAAQNVAFYSKFIFDDHFYFIFLAPAEFVPCVAI